MRKNPNFPKASPIESGGEYIKRTYENTFYTEVSTERARAREYNPDLPCHNNGKRAIYGFPLIMGAWCNSKLKVNLLNQIAKGNIPRHILSEVQEAEQDIRIPNDSGELVYRGIENINKFSKSSESEVVQYLGIATDEPKRIERHKDKKGIVLPLVDIGWTEADAKQWCIDNDLLSPIYTDKCLRGGCWFCHNQGVDQLRQLRHNYPEYWDLLMKWDLDSPTTFHADGHTIHDFDRRFKAEDEGFISADDRFHWNDLDIQQFNIFHYFNDDGSFKELRIIMADYRESYIYVCESSNCNECKFMTDDDEEYICNYEGFYKYGYQQGRADLYNATAENPLPLGDGMKAELTLT